MPRRNPNGAGRKGETSEAVVKRHEILNQRRRIQAAREARAASIPDDSLRSLCREERARRLHDEAVIEDRCRDAVKRADALTAPRKGGRRRLGNLHLTSDPKNALVNACRPDWNGV